MPLNYELGPFNETSISTISNCKNGEFSFTTCSLFQLLLASEDVCDCENVSYVLLAIRWFIS